MNFPPSYSSQLFNVECWPYSLPDDPSYQPETDSFQGYVDALVRAGINRRIALAVERSNESPAQSGRCLPRSFSSIDSSSIPSIGSEFTPSTGSDSPRGTSHALQLSDPSKRSVSTTFASGCRSAVCSVFSDLYSNICQIKDCATGIGKTLISDGYSKASQITDNAIEVGTGMAKCALYPAAVVCGLALCSNIARNESLVDTAKSFMSEGCSMLSKAGWLETSNLGSWAGAVSRVA